MLSIGILLATSSVGTITPSASALPANLTKDFTSTSRVAAVRVLGTSHFAGRTSLQMFVRLSRTGNLFPATLIPSHMLKNHDTEDNKEQPSSQNRDRSFRPHEQNSRNLTQTPSKNKFCRVQERADPSINSHPSQIPTYPTGVLTSAKLIKSDFVDMSWISQRIVRSLQTLFRLSKSIEQKISPISTPALVVSRNFDRNLGHHQQNYEVWLNNRFIATLPTRVLAKSLQARLNRLLELPNFQASQISPKIVDGIPTLMVENRVLFQISEPVRVNTIRSADLLAIEWVNNLRMAMQTPSLSLVEAQTQLYGLTPSQEKLSGLASWYGPYFHGRTTANGETFNENDLTVAHKSLPFNTFLNVRNLKTGKSVIVRVNDRGPYIPPRSLDLSRIAARCINGEDAGVVPYEAVIMNMSRPSLTLNPQEFQDKFRRKHQQPRQIAIVSEL